MNKNRNSSKEILRDIEKNEDNKKRFVKQPILAKITREQAQKIIREEEKEISNKEAEKRQKERQEKAKKERETKEKKQKISKKLSKLNIFKKVKKNIDDEDKNLIRTFVPYIVINGALINFSLFCIADVPFKWYGFLGYGIALWFMENNFIRFVRSLWKSKLR